MSKSNFQLALEIALETKNTKVINKLIDELEEAGVEVSHLRDESKKLNKTFDDLDKKQSLIDSFKKIKHTVAETSAEYEKSQKKTALLSQKMQQASAHADKLKKSIEEQGYATKEQQARYDNSTKAVTQLIKAQGKSVKESSNLQKQQTKLNQSLVTTRKALADNGIATDKLAQAQIDLTKDSKKSEQALTDLTDEAQRLHQIAKAKVTLGLDVEDKIRAEIAEINKAYIDLRHSGTLSQEQLAKASEAHSTKLKELQSQLGRTSTSVEDLFNIRSTNTVEKEIGDVSNALERLRRDYELGKVSQTDFNRKVKAGEERLNALQAELGQTSTALKKNSQSLANTSNDFIDLGKSLAGFAGAYVGVEAVTSGIRELVETSKELDSLNQKLAYATGSAEEAGKTWEYIKQTANELGLEQVALGQGYAQLASATKEMNLSQEQTNGIFEGVANAMAAMSLTGEEAKGTMLALSQIASKGKVSMEELRGQLGERLTPAMGIAAKAMGVTTSELEKMVESGINAKEFLPKFGTALTEAFGEQAQNNINTTTGAINQLTNKVTDVKEQLLDGFAGEGITSGINLLSQGIDQISQAIDNIDPATIELVKESFSQFSDIAQTSFVEVMQIIDSIEDSFNAINVAINGTTAEAEKFSVINSLILGINVSLGAFNDGLKTIGIAFELARGVSAKFFAKVADSLSQITFGDLSDSLKTYATELDKTASEAFERAETKALNFESSAVKAMQNYANATSESMKEVEVTSSQATDKIIQELEAMAGAGSQSAQDIKSEMADTAQSLGIDFELASNKVSKAMQQSVTDVQTLASNFDALKDQGYNASYLIAQGLQNMQDKVKNKADLEALRQLYADFGNQGKLSTAQVEAGLDAVNAKMQKSPDLLDETKKAFEQLGIISKAEAEKQALAQMQAFERVKASNQASNEQLQQALENMSGAIEATGDTAVQTWYEAQKSAQGMSDTVEETTQAYQRQAVAIKEIEQADKQANASQASNASEMIDVLRNVENAMKGRIDDLKQYGATAEQTKQAFDNIMKSRFFDGQSWADIEGYGRAMETLNIGIERQVSNFENARNRAIEHTQALSSANITTKDLSSAQHALRRATDSNVQGLIRMDSQTLSNLQSAIDSARNKMKDLADTAKDTADSIELALAKERGEDAKAREIEQSKKLLELQEKLAEAKSRGNNEEVAGYERAIRAQRELNREQDKNAQKRKKADQTREPERQTNDGQPVNRKTQQTQRTQSNSSQNTTNIPNISINIDTSKVVHQLSEAMQSSAQSAFEKSIKEMSDAIKRRAV